MSIIKRINLPRGIRHEVFKRDKYRCVECGFDQNDTKLHIDHILPISKGGTDEFSNLQTLCEKCNLEKSNLIHTSKITKERIFIKEEEKKPVTKFELWKQAYKKQKELEEPDFLIQHFEDRINSIERNWRDNK